MASRIRCLVGTAVAMAAGPVAAWGPDGHAIVGEIAQRRLSPTARMEVEALLGAGHSLASEATWADDARADRPETLNWHFVDIPIASDTYDARVQCAPSPKGDCIVAALERLRTRLRCGSVESRREALRFATHLVADIHQPFHTVAEEHGGNGIKIDVAIRGARCPRCAPRRASDNLHSLWDSTLIAATARSWGAYVTRLEAGWLAGAEAREAARGTPRDWAIESHGVARDVWPLTRESRYVGDAYYDRVLPLLDRQLGRAGLRLARFLDAAYASNACVTSRISRAPGARRKTWRSPRSCTRLSSSFRKAHRSRSDRPCCWC